MRSLWKTYRMCLIYLLFNLYYYSWYLSYLSLFCTSRYLELIGKLYLSLLKHFIYVENLFLLFIYQVESILSLVSYSLSKTPLPLQSELILKLQSQPLWLHFYGPFFNPYFLSSSTYTPTCVVTSTQIDTSPLSPSVIWSEICNTILETFYNPHNFNGNVVILSFNNVTSFRLDWLR